MHSNQPPARVVSLVPSLTESLFDLGLGRTVVGITDYCIHPSGKLDGITRVGGPADARLDTILDLQPDLVLAGQEENNKDTILALEQAGIKVHLFFPKTVQDVVPLLTQLAAIFQDDDALLKAKTLEVTLEWQAAAALSRPSVKVFYPIWKAVHSSGLPWWMTINADTYSDSVLRLFGAVNVFAGRQRRYPLEADLTLAEPEDPAGRDIRYPRVTTTEIAASGAELVLFPSEPYEFDDSDVSRFCQDFPELPAVRSGRVFTVDGSLISWYGTRLAVALDQLGSLFDL